MLNTCPPEQPDLDLVLEHKKRLVIAFKLWSQPQWPPALGRRELLRMEHILFTGEAKHLAGGNGDHT